MALANLQLQEKLRAQSIRDPLTGLFNRRYFEETLERELLRAERASQLVGLILLDIDHLKRFNDTFGHEAGDHVLQEISGVLRAHTRGSDVASRLGGEELAVVLPGANLAKTQERADSIRQAVEQLALRHRSKALGGVTISAGVAGYPLHARQVGDLVRAADVALYQAKHSGRNRVATTSTQPTPASTPNV